MAISFPTSLDNFTNPSSGNTLDSPSHSLQHSDINDAVEAMQRKVGVGTAVAGSASAGQVLTISAAGTSTWSTLPSSGALVLISTTSISAVSNQAFTSIFTSTYDSYLIDVSLSSVTSGDITLKLRSSTTDSSVNYDYGLAGFGSSASARTASGANGSSVLLNRANTGTASNRVGFQTVIQKPFNAQPTTFLTIASGCDATGWFAWSGGGCHFISTAYDGFNLIFGGTTTGTISIYGYAK